MSAKRVVSVDMKPQLPGAVTFDLEKTLPFVYEEFDLAWCSDVTEHLVNPEDMAA